MKNSNDKRVLEFLGYAFETDINKLNQTAIQKIRRELLSIIDSDIALLLWIEHAKKGKNNPKLREDLLKIQIGFREFFEKYLIPLIDQNFRKRVPGGYFEYGRDDRIIPETQVITKKFLLHHNNHIMLQGSLIRYQDIASEQLLRIFRTGIGRDRFFQCEECGKWVLNTRKDRKGLYCNQHYKRCVDRDAKRLKFSTPAGKKKRNLYMNEWRQGKKEHNLITLAKRGNQLHIGCISRENKATNKEQPLVKSIT